MVLIEVWSLAGEPSGKYLHAALADRIRLLRAHGELHRVANRATDAVIAEVLAMSPATIDRYLKTTRDKRRRLGQIHHQAG